MKRNQFIPLVLAAFLAFSLSTFAYADDEEKKAPVLPFEVSGYLEFMHWLPDDIENVFEIYWLAVFLDGDYGDWGMHFDYRFRDRPLGSYPENNFIEEAYFYYKTDYGNLKIGKHYMPTGIVWDHTWYGPIAYWREFMCNSNYGFVFEGAAKAGENVKVGYAAGWYPSSDGLGGGAFYGAGQEFDYGLKDALVARINPTVTLADNVDFTIGASLYKATIKDFPERDSQAYEVDANLNFFNGSLFVEYIDYDHDVDGPNDIFRGDIFEVEFYYDILKDFDHPFFKGLAFNLSYSKENLDGGNQFGLGELWLPSVVLSFSDIFSLRVIRCDWEVEGVPIDKAWYFIWTLNF